MNANRLPAENSRLVLGIALALWGASVALAGARGSLANVGPQLGLTIAAFATAFGIATYYLDRGVRSVVDSIDARTLAVASAAGLAAIAWIVLEQAPLQALAGSARALVPLFVAPVTIAIQVALLDRLLRWPARTAPSSSEPRKGRGAPIAAA